MVKLSVVLPVYNTQERYLRESIESILCQSFRDFELIIINDGSSISSVEDVILSYKDERIKYIKQENIGVANTLNKGLNIARGEYVARMDADDVSHKDRFSKQIDFLDKNPSFSICGTNIETLRPNGSLKYCKHPEEPKMLDFLKNCYISHPTIMLRIKDFRKFDLKYDAEYKCEDYELWSRAVKYLNFYNIQEPLLQYRIHGDNLSLTSKDFSNHVKQVKKNMISSLTSNDKVKNALMKKYVEKKNYWRNIFSISNGVNAKIVTILGLRINL